MLIAILIALALGISIWTKSRRLLAAGQPYVFGAWDGGLLLRGEEWEPRHTLWIGRGLVLLALAAVAVPFALEAPREWRRTHGGPCEQVLTSAELAAAGLQLGAEPTRFSYGADCGVLGAGYRVEMRRGPIDNVLRSRPAVPIATIPGAVLWSTQGDRHLTIQRGNATMDLAVPDLDFPTEKLVALAQLAAGRAQEFEALEYRP